ncbi:MAG: aspartate/glutamate racemase family protein [Oligoflexales bacterium]
MTPRTCFSTILGVLFPTIFLVACNSNPNNPQISELHHLYKEVARTLPSQATYSFDIYEQQIEKIKTYKKIQEEIAKQIPNEYDRPIIELKVFFNHKKQALPNIKIGILGGIGPLSDANIMEKLLERLESSNSDHRFMIHLLSMPPPRSLWEQIKGGLSYIGRLYNFGSLNYENYFLASNTAHLHHGKFSRLVKTSVFHLPDAVLHRIKQHPMLNKEAKILVLDTSQANKSRLYQDLFLEQGITFTNLNKLHREKLEHWITKIKASAISSQENRQFFLFISELCTHYQSKAIILACTEIPLALSDYIPRLIENGIEIVDSESILIEAIADYLANPKHIKDGH